MTKYNTAKGLIKGALFVFILFLNIGAFAQNNQMFEEANALYNEGNYAEAIDKYMAILNTDVHSAELYFNLANANYKLNNIAPSIYYYEKALQLNPNDSDIKNNLAFAKNMTIDAIDTIPDVGLAKFIKIITKALHFNDWAILAVALIIAFVLLFLTYYFAYSTRSKRFAFIGSLSLLTLGFIALSFAFHNYNLAKMDRPAIVFAEESQIKTEPNLRSEEAFRLHEGTKIQVLDTINDWKKIKLSDGKTGWVVSKDIKMLNDF